MVSVGCFFNDNIKSLKDNILWPLCLYNIEQKILMADIIYWKCVGTGDSPTIE